MQNDGHLEKKGHNYGQMKMDALLKLNIIEGMIFEKMCDLY